MVLWEIVAHPLPETVPGELSPASPSVGRLVDSLFRKEPTVFLATRDGPREPHVRILVEAAILFGSKHIRECHGPQVAGN